MLRCFVATLLLSTAVLAQVKETPAAKKAPPKSEIIFGEGSDIFGDRDVPEGLLVEATYRPVFSGLIKIRQDFNDKLADSVFEL